MTITERQEQILNKIIQEYISSAQPVSSCLLEEKYNFGICPATIRNEMQKLTEEELLFQPHTSSGRVPTDKGYRFFVDNLLKEEIFEFEDILEIEEILRKERKDVLKWASQLTKFLAEESSNFAIFQLLDKDFLFKEGWEEVLKEPEFEERDLVSGFAKLLDNFERNIKNLKINSEIRIFIGEEDIFGGAKDFSIISSSCKLGKKEKGIISILGPKRMAYDKNISLVNSLKRLSERF